MKIEKIRKINKSKIIIGGLIGLGVIGAITILPSYSKYRTTQSFSLVNGKITYKAADMNVIAMYTSEDGKSYSEYTGRMPSSGYAINEKESYCNLNGEKDTNVRLYTENGKHIMENLIKGNKCYLYFDKYVPPITKDDIIAGATSKSGSFTGPTSASSSDAGIFKTSDPVYGNDTYYYRGLVTNNYVSFANKCWRIVRINGNGSIRIIYDGPTCSPNGTNANSITHTGIKYNNSNSDNAYVGYMFGSAGQSNYENTHKNTNPSNIKGILDSWYTTNIADAGFAYYIDKEAGFCNDRSLASNYAGKGYAKQSTHYVAFERMFTNSPATPSFDCPNAANDLFTPTSSSKGNHQLGTKPVGLITADEVVFAGGFYNSASTNYWLYNEQYYWTMSPHDFDGGGIRVFYVNNDGNLGSINYVNNTYGVRPVINLKTGTVFKAGTDGTIGNEYKVVN